MLETEDRLITRREVERLVGLARPTIYRMLKSGRFPRPVRIGSTAVRWRLSEVVAWVEGLPRSEE